MAIDLREVWNSRSEFLTSPGERKKVVALGAGVATTVIVVIIVVVLIVTGVGREAKGSDALRSEPLIIGRNNFLDIIRKNFKNDISGLDFENLQYQCPECHTDLNRFKSGEVGAVFWAVGAPCDHPDAITETLEQIDLMQRLIDRYPKKLELTMTKDDLDKSIKRGRIAGMFGLIGGHLIDSRLGLLRLYKKLGVKYMTLMAGCPTPWARDLGLTRFGGSVIKEMNRLGMVVDLSGSTEVVQHSVMLATKAPVIFANSASSFLCDKDGNVGDESLRYLRDNGGVFMLNLDPEALCGGEPWKVLDHLTHIVRIVGIEHVGLSMANVKNESSQFSDITRYPLLFDLLNANDSTLWSVENLRKLAGENVMRVLEEVEKVQDNMADQQPGQRWIPYQDLEGFDTKCRTIDDSYDNATKPTSTTSTTPTPTTEATTPSTTSETTTTSLETPPNNITSETMTESSSTSK